MSDSEVLLGASLFVLLVYFVWIPLSWNRFYVLPFITTPLVIAIGLALLFQNKLLLRQNE